MNVRKLILERYDNIDFYEKHLTKLTDVELNLIYGEDEQSMLMGKKFLEEHPDKLEALKQVYTSWCSTDQLKIGIRAIKKGVDPTRFYSPELTALQLSLVLRLLLATDTGMDLVKAFKGLNDIESVFKFNELYEQKRPLVFKVFTLEGYPEHVFFNDQGILKPLIA